MMFRFGCGHLPLDETIHEASWGARLIYREVAEGSSGVVFDRQTPEGEPETVRLLFPVVDRALEEFREHQYELDSGQSGHLCWRDGRVLVVMSPQGSYGYLYITAVLEREGHEGESKVWGQDGEWAEGELADRAQLGNWPPEIVAAREAKEKERERQYALGWVATTAREARWAESAVWGSRTERTRTIRQKKADKAADEAAQAVARALALGFTLEECAKAQGVY